MSGAPSVRSIITKLRCDHVNCGAKRRWETALSDLLCNQQRCKELERKEPKDLKWLEIMSAFKYRIRTGAVLNLTYIEPDKFMEDAFVLIKRRLQRSVKKLKCVKVNFVFVGDYIKPGVGDEEAEGVISRKYFQTKNFKIVKSDDLNEVQASAIKAINKQMSEFTEKGSSWSLSSIINLTVNINAVCDFSA